MSSEHERFMRLALEEAARAKAEGNGAFGAVVVRDGEVVGAGRNQAVTTSDPTAHAETMALREAGKTLGTLDLTDCTLYATYQPCPMCCGAIPVTGISRVVIGARRSPGEYPWPGYSVERIFDTLGWGDRIEVISGVLEDECRAIAGPFDLGRKI